MSRPVLRANDIERLVKRNFCDRYYSYDVTGDGLKQLAHDTSAYKESSMPEISSNNRPESNTNNR